MLGLAEQSYIHKPQPCCRDLEILRFPGRSFPTAGSICLFSQFLICWTFHWCWTTHGWHLSMSKHLSLCKISMKCSVYRNFCKPTQSMSFLWNGYSEPSSGSKYNISIKEMCILVTAKVDMHISDKLKCWHNYLPFLWCALQLTTRILKQHIVTFSVWPSA